jgi:hypothetical protein
MRNGKNQLYGTQAVWDNVLKKNKIYPTENIESVNERRKKLGLETLEDYAKANGYLLLMNE